MKELIASWNGYNINFKDVNGTWYGSVEDIGYILDMSPYFIAENVGDEYLTDMDKETYISEEGIYQLISHSHVPIARKFQTWSFRTMCKLRKLSGLEPYEVMRMLDEDVQQNIDNILDTLYWDEEKGCVMQSVTVAGGDVEQIPFEEA